MALGRPADQGVHMAARGNSPRSSPGSLQTLNAHLNRTPRFSYMETPLEMQRPQFQLSSPTNSTIDESPISPEAHTTLPPALQNSASPPYPIEKIHPPHFAPVAEQTVPAEQRTPLFSEQPPSQQQRYPPPAPTLIKHPMETMSPVVKPIHNHDMNQSAAASKADVDQRRLVYNPNSLAGPNVAPETHRPGQVSHPNSAIEPQWKHGLCELDSTCCLGLFCPCILYGRTQYRIRLKAEKQDPTDLLGYKSMNGSCGLMAVSCGFQWIFAAIQRTRIRKLYHLKGSFGSDCIKSFCCCCCVLMQDDREVREREDLIRRHAGPASGPYMPPESMIYAPPPR
ncbi:hypothetical protein MMC24_007498 [Lignoscripta atroalba]|nr:hypothetical protein [Lignoscripta atroalba]